MAASESSGTASALPGSRPEMNASSLTNYRQGNGRQTNQRHDHEEMADDKRVAKTRSREEERDNEVTRARYHEAAPESLSKLGKPSYNQHPSTITDATRRSQTSQVPEKRDVGGTGSHHSKSKLSDRDLHVYSLERRVANLEGQNFALIQESNGLRQELQQSKEHMSSMEQRLRWTTELLDARTKEWEIAQQFLTTSDSLTESDVVQMVTRLNSEIFQFAGRVTSVLPSHQRRKPGNINSEIPIVLSNGLLKFLKNSCAAADPSAAIQVVIQTVLITYCTHLVSYWHGDNVFDDQFKSLYSVLQHTVEPSIAGKWRALTRSSLDRLHDKDLESRLITSTMSAAMLNILVAAGFDHPAHLPMLKRDLNLIACLTLELRRGIVAIESCDLETFFYPTDIPFDPNGMAKNFEETRTRTINAKGMIRTPRVFLTTEMGLKRMNRTDDRKRRMQRVQDILLQPKVVLDSDLQNLL